MRALTRSTIDLNWQLGMHQERETGPQEWVPAAVPGAVQLDWGQAHGYASYLLADHYLDYRWMEDVYWTYRTRLDIPTLGEGDRLFFVCGGVDYRFQVGLGDAVLHDQEGMFTPVEIELTGLARPGMNLWVCVYPVPKSFTPDPDLNDHEKPRKQADHSCKPAVSYGWDFHPRLTPLGIWQETWLEIRPAAYLARVGIDYRLNDAFDRVDLTVEAEVDGDPVGSLLWELVDPEGAAVLAQEMPARRGKNVLRAALERPRLWWPHDQGQPECYTSRVTFSGERGSIDAQEQKIGFRRVRLVMNENAWRYPEKYPKPRSHAPMTLEINGKRIFAKGSNWVSPQIFPGLLERAQYETQLNLAKQANMNILRCWGGAPVMKEDFFDLCDSLGIMVWQEFPLACNDYPDDPAYLTVLDQESRSIIQRLKDHPSLVLWCGGNELFNVWSGMDDQSLPLRLLNSNCYQLDPERPFIYTSPIDGVAHGPYATIDASTGMETWALFQQSAYTAYCEFGAGSAMPPVETLRSIIPAEALFPVSTHPAWVAHHAVTAQMQPYHLHLDAIEAYFGPSTTIEELVERSQFLQAEGLRGDFEEVRRQKMEASMAINWCFNEPWPNAANLSLIAWPNTPKPGLQRVGEALRPVLVSARIRKMKWSPGETFDPELWILSDSPNAVPAGRVQAWLKLGEEEIFLLEWSYPGLLSGVNLKGPKVQVALPATAAAGRFQLILTVPQDASLNSTYTLLLS